MNFRFNYYIRKNLYISCFSELLFYFITLIFLLDLKDYPHSKSLFYYILIVNIFSFICLIVGIILLAETYSYYKKKRIGTLINLEIENELLIRKKIILILSYHDERGNKRIIRSRPFYSVPSLKFNPVDYFYSFINKSEPVKLYFYIGKNKEEAYIEGLVNE